MRPDIAIAYLKTLSTHIKAVAITTADGRHLAGDRTVANPLRVADAHHVILVELHPGALESVVKFDLRSVLGDLARR